LPLVQGMTGELTLAVTPSSTVEGTLADRPLIFHPQDAGLTALQGMHVQTPPGTYPLQIKVTAPDGRVSNFQQDVLLVRGNYATELTNLQVPSELLDPTAMNEELARMAEIVGASSADRYWSGAFTPPSVLGIISWFGNTRTYNGGAFTSFHGGVDYYGSEGTPILAPAAGKVVFAGPMTICGNSIVLYHGWNVYSRVCHQSKFEVQVDDMVQQGQVIGKVGKTGRATGPHLHWELWVGGVQVNPLDWIENTYP
jgi:murein DD-endopeptidase MepM/ murein hydrolase activator NlpD